MSRFAFLSFLVALVMAGSVFAQKGLQDGGSSSQITVYGGATTVTFSSGFAAALESLQIGVGRISPGAVRAGRAIFPITDGTLDTATLRGEIVHKGGLELSRGGTQVRLQSFIIDTSGSGGIVLTGLVSANGSVVGRVPLFNLTLPGSGSEEARDLRLIRLNNVAVTLRPEAAGALNSVFQTNAFVAGFDIGRASVVGIAVGEDD